MKKTIAILLILVIGMVGVFAENYGNAKLNISADVSNQSLIKITDIAVTDSETQEESGGAYTFSTFAAFNALPDEVTTSAVIDESNFSAKVVVGHLNYWSNNATGLKTTVSATVLKDNTTEEPTNSSQIGYSVYLGTDASPAVTVSKTQTSNTGLEQTLISALTTRSASGSKAINVMVVADDYRLALASDKYTATITFNYIAN